MPTYRVTPTVQLPGHKQVWGAGEPPTAADPWHLAEGPGLPGKVWFKLVNTADRGWVCTDVRIEADRPLTTSVLRSIPLSRIIDQLLTQPMTEEMRGGALDLATNVRDYYEADEDMSDEDARREYLANGKQAAIDQRAGPQRGGSGPSADDLKEFAATYELALKLDRSRPIAATAERMHISRATAHRWRAIITKTGDSTRPDNSESK